MPLVIPVNFGQITWIFAGSGVPHGAAVTLGFGGFGADPAQTLADAAKAAFATTIMPQLIQNVGLVRTLVKLGPNATGPQAESLGSTDGGDLSAQAPPMVAYLVKKTTALGGRKNRGRMYLPGVDETEVSQTGLIASTKLTPLQTALTNLFIALTAANMDPHILHSDATGPTPIGSFILSSIVATQRRRLRR